MAAAAAGIYLTSPSLASPLLPAAIALFWCSVPFLGVSRPDRVLLVLFGVIIGSAWLSVAFSAYSAGSLALTLWLAILTTVLAPLAWVKDLKLVLAWLVPVWLAHAVLSLYQWMATDLTRVVGLSDNSNVGAAFLLLGCVAILNGNSRARWLVLPLVAALPFTGARWVAVVASVVLLSLFAGRWVPWKYTLVGIAATVAVVTVAGWDDIFSVTIARANTLSVHVGGYDYLPDLPPSWTPRGFYDSGIHIVPWRMMHETGIASGLAWVGATLYGLWRRPRFDTRWWLLATVGMLSLMDYYVWLGPLGGWWWLLVKHRDKIDRDAGGGIIKDIDCVSLLSDSCRRAGIKAEG